MRYTNDLNFYFIESFVVKPWVNEKWQVINQKSFSFRPHTVKFSSNFLSTSRHPQKKLILAASDLQRWMNSERQRLSYSGWPKQSLLCYSVICVHHYVLQNLIRYHGADNLDFGIQKRSYEIRQWSEFSEKWNMQILPNQRHLPGRTNFDTFWIFRLSL